MSQSVQSLIDVDLVDLERLAGWMDAQDLPRGPIEDTALLAGGTQNILLRFTRGGLQCVLRRPPRHLRSKSNETMCREARVLSALATTNVPHPRLIAACTDTDVIGAAFYLMQPIDGFNPTTGLPEPHKSDPTIRHAMGLALVDGIAALGRVDYRKVGLEGFGRPDGFLERQVERWRSQLTRYGELDDYPGPDIPGLDRVAGWLDRHRPRQRSPGILHGDYHLANVMFAPTGPALAAIVDWELCTVGDPLLDLGWLLATWPDNASSPMGPALVTPWEGFPTATELIDRYRDGTTRDLTAIDWYAVLACYKLGIILEGTHARACAGKADRATGDFLHTTTVALFERALQRIA